MDTHCSSSLLFTIFALFVYETSFSMQPAGLVKQSEPARGMTYKLVTKQTPSYQVSLSRCCIRSANCSRLYLKDPILITRHGNAAAAAAWKSHRAYGYPDVYLAVPTYTRLMDGTELRDYGSQRKLLKGQPASYWLELLSFKFRKMYRSCLSAPIHFHRSSLKFIFIFILACASFTSKFLVDNYLTEISFNLRYAFSLTQSMKSLYLFLK